METEYKFYIWIGHDSLQELDLTVCSKMQQPFLQLNLKQFIILSLKSSENFRKFRWVVFDKYVHNLPDLVIPIPYKEITEISHWLYLKYHISSNKRRVANKRRLLVSATPLGIHIEISTSKCRPSNKRRTSKCSAY